MLIIYEHIQSTENTTLESPFNIVTYSGFSIHDGSLLHSKSQYTTVKHSRKLSEHVHVRPARSRNTHSSRILPTGPLMGIFQRSLPFLQSESFQTHQVNPSSGYRSAYTPQRHLGIYIISLH
jgi:hypothetical protein